MNQFIFKGFLRKAGLCFCLPAAMLLHSCKTIEASAQADNNRRSYRLNLQILPEYDSTNAWFAGNNITISLSLPNNRLSSNGARTETLIISVASPEKLTETINTLNQSGVIVEHVTSLNEN